MARIAAGEGPCGVSFELRRIGAPGVARASTDGNAVTAAPAPRRVAKWRRENSCVMSRIYAERVLRVLGSPGGRGNLARLPLPPEDPWTRGTLSLRPALC